MANVKLWYGSKFERYFYFLYFIWTYYVSNIDNRSFSFFTGHFSIRNFLYYRRIGRCCAVRMLNTCVIIFTLRKIS